MSALIFVLGFIANEAIIWMKLLNMLLNYVVLIQTETAKDVLIIPVKSACLL
jgi:hypothetical protein